MVKIPIKSLSDYIEIIESIKKEDAKYLFRGHSSVTFRLIPSIWRNRKVEEDVERTMLNEFKRCYYPYTDERPHRSMDFLFLAQHYGMKTRLLDWTFNPLIALYFACESKDIYHKGEMGGCVYVKMIPNALLSRMEEEKEDIDPFSANVHGTTIVLPDNTDIRYRNQQGVFEYFPNSTQESSDICNCIFIPDEYKDDILNSLSTMGIDRLYVYPTLMELSKTINEKYTKNEKN